MCGIVAAINQGKAKEPVNQFIRDQFEDQKNRGISGFGAVVVNQDRTYTLYRATEPSSIHVDLALNKSRMIFFHHRTPTSSDNLISQTHPIFVSNESLKYDYLVMHNGVINNNHILKLDHEKLGFQYNTELIYEDKSTKFNDSEALAIEVARFIECQTKELGTTGSWAFIALQIHKKQNKIEKVYFGRNMNPLNLVMSWGTIKLSSEGPGEEITEDTLYELSLLNIGSKKFKKFKLNKTPMPSKAYYPITTIPHHGVSKLGNEGFTDWNTGRNTSNITPKPQGSLAEEDEEAAEEFLENKMESIKPIIENFMIDIQYSPDPDTIDFKEPLRDLAEILAEIKHELIKNLNEKAIVDSLAEGPINGVTEEDFGNVTPENPHKFFNG
jgi:predicted glutamine amidotransferase